jgi:transmembrane sensor
MKTDPTYPADLITSYFAGEASGDDLVFLSEWLKADPEHREFFESCRDTWNSLEKQRIDSQIDLNAEWKTLREKIDLSSEASETKRIPIYSRKTFRLAALLVILLIPAWLLYNFLSSPVMKKMSAETAWIEGKLPDGTSVSLNAGSVVEYPSRFSKNERDIKLIGEAYFEVAHDKTKPFIIASGNVRVEVLGTKFYVNTNAPDGRVEVILTGGSVAVYYGDKISDKVILSPGEKAEVATDKYNIATSVNDDPNYLSWKTHKLVFSGDPLDEVVGTLNKTYHADIRITNPALSGCLITATFDNQALEPVLHVIAATLDLKIDNHGTWTGISGNGCK